MALIVNITEKEPKSYNVAVAGTLDSNTFSILERELDKVFPKKPNLIVFDFQGLDYISSAGVRVVSKTRKVMKEHNGIVLMVNLQPQIKDVFDIIKALPAEQVFESIKELDDYLYAMQNKRLEEMKP